MTFTYSATEAPATFECRLETPTSTGTFSACGGPTSATTNQVSWTYSGLTTNGTYTFHVKATDESGNTDTSPASRQFTLDTVPPAAPTINTRPPELVSTRTASWTFSSEPGATFQCSIDSTASTACSSGSGHTVTVSSDGTHTFRVRATDQAGNPGPYAEDSWTVDTTNPTLTFNSGPNGQRFGSGSTQTWTFTAADATSGVQSVQCKVVATGSTGPFGACSGGTSSHSVSNLPIGSYTMSVRVTDRVGKTVESSRTFSIVPLLRINDVGVTEGNSGSKNALFTVRLSAASQQQITVRYATANGTAIAPGDYTAKSGTLTFLAGQTTKTVVVPVRGDTRNEANETFFVRLSGAVNAAIADASGRGTIIDND